MMTSNQIYKMISEYINYIISNTKLNPKNFLEIGSRDGIDAHKISKRFGISANKIYLVEPYPYHIGKIKDNFPQYQLFECGIYHQKGKFRFYGIHLENKEHSGVSSFLDRNDDLYQQAKDLNALEILELETITGKDLLDQIGEETIDLCDLDVEGVTYEVLLSFENDISKIKTLHFECETTQIWKDQLLYQDIKQYLESKNFIEVHNKPIYHTQLDLIYINKTYGETISPIINA